VDYEVCHTLLNIIDKQKNNTYTLIRTNISATSTFFRVIISRVKQQQLAEKYIDL